MSERKNIEHLFQEKLEHFDVIPPEQIWKNIETELKKEKKRKKIIPFWWKLSGVAALFILGFGIHAIVNNSENPKEVINKKNTIIVSKEKENSAGNSTENTNDEIVNQKESSLTQTNSENSKITNEDSSVKKTHQKEHNSINVENLTNLNNPSERITTASSKTKKQNGSNQIENTNLNNLKSVVEAKYNSANLNEKNSNNTLNNPIENKSSSEQNNQVLPTNINNLFEEKIVAKNSNEINQTKIDINKKIDSSGVANVEPNAMEELQNEKEKKSNPKPKPNRWQITPNLAPIYFGSFTSGSPLDESLNNNNKIYNNEMGYGIAVNYSVSKKVKIRTGVNVFSVNYDTQGIIFYQDTNAKVMKNINPTNQGALIQIKPIANVNLENQYSRMVSERFDGILNQKMGYIEMPIEMTYKILNKKFGIDFVGGFSTLFLNENEIFLKADGLNMKIGTATNLNNIHFSSNLGLGFNYKFFKNFDARIEPLFKYQINTLSSNSSDYKPYLFGIYSGISYHF